MGAKMWPGIARKLKDTSGQSFVEMALVAPILFLIIFGIFDFSRAILANNIINMSREGASLALRTTRDPQDIMNSLAFTAKPLHMETDGMMHITKCTIKNGAVTAGAPIDWEGNKNDIGLESNIGNIANSLGAANGKPSVADGDVYVFEVFYRYRFLFEPFYLMCFPTAPTGQFSSVILHSKTIL
jgi:hypothetical protein